ncbi:MAG: DHA2 family efflux MFS transporter permease subunit [Candidatus Dormibacteraeota bacterium]|nr:DHA2 family efflux MFS transporter permease subunit [Candidatus Dormibacteraeota bacterium]MBV9526264.1 DHA2 family efflux MFS transporter permease subunit [Candidatus Dormibacteraeota bacterium]
MTEVLTEPQAATIPEADDEVEVAHARVGRFDYKWVALGVVLLGTIMTILDATIVNIAIPTLQADLKAGSYNDIAWVVTGYMLAQGAVIPMTGWATDRFGTKRLYLITITLFTLASMACGLAQNLGELIFFRIVQGIGGGMLMPIGMTIILKAVGGQNMGKIMGVFGVPMLLAPALGPVLGGWFVQSFTWRLIFYVNVPIGIVAFIAATRFLVETHKTHGLHLDAFGLLTATPAVVAILYAVDQSTSLGWTSATVVTLLVVAAVLAAAFVLSQLDRRRAATLLMFPLFIAALAMGVRGGLADGWTHINALAMFGAAAIALVNVPLGRRGSVEPLLQLRLFKDGTFSWAMVLSFIIVTALFGAMLLLPLYLQQIRGYNALQTGLLLLPQAVTAAFAMPLGGSLSDRFGPRPVVALGLVMLAAGGVLLAQLHVDSPIWLIVGALLLRGFAMGFCMMPSMAAALARVAPEFSSRASSITNSLQRIGSSIGIAVLVTVLVAQVSTSTHQTVCAPPQSVLVAASSVQHQTVTAQALCGQLQSTLSSSTLQGSAGAPRSSGNAIYDGFVHTYAGNVMSTSFDRTFAFIAIITLVGLIPAFFLRKPERSSGTVALAA